MSEHLTQEQIEHYVGRTGGADEILSVAEHLDECWDCRDRMAAIVDPGTGERPHRGASRRTSMRNSGRYSALQDSSPSQVARLLPWLIGAILLAAVIIAVLLSR
ncbi:MAG: hypothetical protein JWO56_3502 [Acidobacteria bacterium]|nr:hypothetical protein [Acidobacteriota bacterium]